MGTELEKQPPLLAPSVYDATSDVKVMSHVRESGDPVRLSPAELKTISTIELSTSLYYIGLEWVKMFAAMSILLFFGFQSTWLYALYWIYIAGRQQALSVFVHEGVHYRIAPAPILNDILTNLTCAFPAFLSVESFRYFHGRHHRYLNEERDGNREVWFTHKATGEIEEEWIFPKTTLGLLFMLFNRTYGFTGVRWMIRTFIAEWLQVLDLTAWRRAYRIVYTLAFASAFTYFQCWDKFFWLWIFPYCTSHITVQYIRLIAEHSRVASTNPDFSLTRSTLLGPLGRELVLPANVGYHIEHHIHPSVPFYNLPKLHELLMRRTDYKKYANVHYSLWTVYKEIISGQDDLVKKPQ